jgi:hypothetical protein
VLWTSLVQDGDRDGVFGQRYDPFGLALAGEFRVNTSTTGHQAAPDVALFADGSFVVVWTSDDGSGRGVFGQRFHANGARRGAEFRINSYTTNNQNSPSVAADASGSFAVSWESGLNSSYDVYTRFFDATGTPQGAEFRVNTYTGEWAISAGVAAAANGTFVMSWSGRPPYSNFEQDIFARLPLDLIFRDGFDPADPED